MTPGTLAYADPMPSPRHRSTLTRRALGALTAVALGGALVVTGSATSGAATTPTGATPPAEGNPLVDIALDPVVTAGTLDSPIAMATRAGSDDLFVAERPGRVQVLHVSGANVTVDPTPLLDITGFTGSDGEGGLLGITFNPAGDRLYVDHTNVHGNLRIAEYTLAEGGGGPVVVPGSRRVLLSIRHQPFGNHNGGDITFGPDGRLYISVGDGGGGGDPDRNGQNRTALLGKILRINPQAGATRPYKIPVTNPFVGQSPRRGEIWLYGVRNPWRISFDSATGDFYVADVGQDVWEEIDVLTSDSGGHNAGRGVNLGWSRMEGTDTFNGTEPANHTPPLFEYPHEGAAPGEIEGCSIIGGYVYHGTAIPALVGQYVFGDFCTGVLSSITATDGTLVGHQSDMGDGVAAFSLQSFGQGPDGELYALSGDGSLSRLEPAGT